MCLCTVEEREREREKKCEGENKKGELACSDCIRVAPTWPANPCNKRRLCVERERTGGHAVRQQQQQLLRRGAAATKHNTSSSSGCETNPYYIRNEETKLVRVERKLFAKPKKVFFLDFFLFYSADVPPAFPAQDPPPPPRPLTAQLAEIPPKASHFWAGHILQRLWGLSGSWNCGPMEARGCVRAGAKNGKKNWKKKRDKERHSISRSERKRGSFK